MQYIHQNECNQVTTWIFPIKWEPTKLMSSAQLSDEIKSIF